MGFEAVELEVEGSAGVGAGGWAEAEAVLACELLDLWKGGVLDSGFEVDEEHGEEVCSFVSLLVCSAGWLFVRVEVCGEFAFGGEESFGGAALDGGW